MANGKDESRNPNRKVGRGHPLLKEQQQQRREAGFSPDSSSFYDRDLEERLRQRPRINPNE